MKKLNTLMILSCATSFVSAALVVPNILPAVSGNVHWYTSPVVTARQDVIRSILDDGYTPIDDARITQIGADAIAQEIEDIKKHRLQSFCFSVIAAYEQDAGLHDDELCSLRERLMSKNMDAATQENMLIDKKLHEVTEIFIADPSEIIDRAINTILQTHSFKSLDDVTTAMKLLEHTIRHEFERSNIHTNQILDELTSLNLDKLSADYASMKKVSGLLAQLSPESSAAIRSKFPWYLKKAL